MTSSSRRHRLVVVDVCLTAAWILLLLALLPPVSTAASADDGCAANLYYYCPNCDGMNVTDCLSCDGYLNTDPNHKICFDRQLFAPYNDDPTDPANYYVFLWRDILAAFIWFLAAGVATACGVGGGGIYVPLGMILLLFAPKPASGLSQASIFGASLGGLALNLRDQHPSTDKKKKDGFRRPLIDYNMALFLAPMEMAGAVLGVLIQKILPNWLYLCLAAVILGFTAYKTYKKWWSTRATERKRAAEAKAAAEAAAAAANSDDAPSKDENEEGVESADGETSAATTATDGAAAAAAAASAQEQPAAALDASMNTRHKETTPTVGKVDWTAASQVYQYPSGSITNGAVTNGGDAMDGGDGSKDDKVVELGVSANANASNEEEKPVDEKNNTTKIAEQFPLEGPLEHAPDDNDEDKNKDGNNPTEIDQKRQYWLDRDARQYPTEKLLALVLLWMGLILLTFMKGGKGVESIIGITCESPWYGALIAIQFVWTFSFAVRFGIKLVTEQQAKEACDYPFLDNDVLWDRSKLRFYAFFTFLAGIVAGLIGIGGGMVLGPLMLVMGIHPRVSTATTGTMVALTSSSVAVLFVTAGLVPWEYAVFFFCVCLVGALIGKTYIDGYVKRSGKASVLIFLLATIIALATVGCVVIVLTRLQAAGWCLDSFNRFCDPSTKDDGECMASSGARFLLANGLSYRGDNLSL